MLGVRCEEFPLAVLLSVIQLDTMWAFLARFFFGRSQPFCSVGFPVRLSARAV